MGPQFNETSCNEVGTVLRTSRLISLAYLADQEHPKYGPTGTKKGLNKAKKQPVGHINRPRGPNLGWKGWNKVGKPLRSSRLISLGGYLPNLECPKCGPTGAKKGQKQAENSLLATQISSEGIYWWNKVGKPMKTSRQTSMGHLPHPECPKFGPTGTKKGPKQSKNSLLPQQFSSKGIFQVGRGGTRLEHQSRHPDRPVWAI